MMAHTKVQPTFHHNSCSVRYWWRDFRLYFNLILKMVLIMSVREKPGWNNDVSVILVRNDPAALSVVKASAPGHIQGLVKYDSLRIYLFIIYSNLWIFIHIFYWNKLFDSSFFIPCYISFIFYLFQLVLMSFWYVNGVNGVFMFYVSNLFLLVVKSFYTNKLALCLKTFLLQFVVQDLAKYVTAES